MTVKDYAILRIRKFYNAIRNSDILKKQLFWTIIGVTATLLSAYFAYLAITISKEISEKQMEFSKEINRERKIAQKPYLVTYKGKIAKASWEKNNYTFNMEIENLGMRPAENLMIGLLFLNADDSLKEFNVLKSQVTTMANPFPPKITMPFETELMDLQYKEIYLTVFFQFTDYVMLDTTLQIYYFHWNEEKQGILLRQVSLEEEKSIKKFIIEYITNLKETK